MARGHRFRLVTEGGDDEGIRVFGRADWDPGDVIPLGEKFLVVVEVLAADPPVLIVREQ